MRKVHWLELTTEEFAALDPEKAIAVLPIAAIEQHGPHLAVSTDTIIGQGMIDAVIARLPDDLSVLFLPVQAVGKSNEHIRSPGTITYTAETAQRVWTEIGESVARAGVRKLVIVTSHGGNVPTIDIVARDLRVRQNMLVVTCAWQNFGYPDGLFDGQERIHGIHAGAIETSIVLAAAKDLVRMDKAPVATSAMVALEKTARWLRLSRPAGFGWMAQDLHPSGAVGDATAASAERGETALAHGAKAFVELLGDVDRFDLAQLGAGPLG
jgi:creatinine amidohydrolase